ncbi:MAG: hypothetical protein M1833_003421 [Piccolia ochrophora]|nr:MAG: hypothetical protein M1833_003421 [Piccolia ochrophora]
MTPTSPRLSSQSERLEATQTEGGEERRDQPTSRPVEMSNLPTVSQADSSTAADRVSPSTAETPNMSSSQTIDEEGGKQREASRHTEPVSDMTATQKVSSPTAEARPPINREQSTAIGPSSDQPTFKETDSVGPMLMITLLLTSGARHPYKIDDKYLKKRSVNAAENDPFNISVYTLKELIWREWREGQNRH